MTPDRIRDVIVSELGRIAPELSGTLIDRHVNLRDEYDLDSMDFLNLMVALHDELGVDIPEADYGQLASLDAAVAYLAAKVGPSEPARREDPA